MFVPGLFAGSILGLLPVVLGLPLATFDGGAVTGFDVWREGRWASPGELRYREQMAVPPAATLDAWTQRAALRRLALSWVEQGEPPPELVQQMRAARRSLVVDWWRARDFGRRPPLPGPNELRAEAERVAPKPPDRLLLWHVYQRAETPGESEAARQRLLEWRSRITDRASFEAVAAGESDSQSRRRDGYLGWTPRGYLPEPVEAALYALPEGSVSPPLEVRGGWHLFWVETIEVDRPPQVDRMRQRLEDEARREASERALRDALADARRRFRVELGSGEWPEIRVGAWRVPDGVLEAVAPAGARPEEAAASVVEDELLFQLAIDTGAVGDELRARMDDVAGQAAHEWRTRSAIAGEITEPTPGELRVLYQAETERFHRPAVWDLAAIRVPIPTDTDPLERFRQLEFLVASSRAAENGWPWLAESIGNGEPVDPPTAAGVELANLLGPPVFEAAARAEVGDVIGPIQDAGFFWVVAVEAREPRRQLTFDEAEQHLRSVALNRRARALGAAYGDRLLAAADFSYTPVGEKWLGDGN
jgi:hypothetical protein